MLGELPPLPHTSQGTELQNRDVLLVERRGRMVNTPAS
jgi:hypothetical protein